MEHLHGRRAEPDQFIANLGGSGVRLPGEPNPEPVGRSRTRCCARQTRLARGARRTAGSKGLRDVQYVVLDLTPVPGAKPRLSMYLAPGHDPPYVTSDLHGRHVSRPGRG